MLCIVCVSVFHVDSYVVSHELPQLPFLFSYKTA